MPVAAVLRAVRRLERSQRWLAGLTVIWALSEGASFLLLRGRSYVAPPLTAIPDAPNSGLQVVDSLSTRFDAQRSAVWTPALELAWKHARASQLGGPIKVNGSDQAISLVDRLEKSAATTRDCPEATCRSWFGPASQARSETTRLGWIDTSPLPETAWVAYASLDARVSFPMPYYDADTPLVFRHPAGPAASVRAFGILDKHAYAYPELRSQIRMLFSSAPHEKPIRSADRYAFRPQAFALDLCAGCDTEVVVGVVSPAETLGALLARIDSSAASYDGATRFGPSDTLLVPEQAWETEHHFAEVDRAQLSTEKGEFPTGLWRTRLRFRLDRSGAEVRAEAKLPVLPIPSDYVLDRPHFVMLRRRGAPNPYFAVWVATPDLLRPAP